MKRLLGIVVLVLLATAALSACGGAGGDDGGTAAATTAAPPPAPTHVGDRALARRALVRRADFPDEWVQQGAPATDLRCDGTDPFVGARALVGSKRIVLDDVGVQETVAVFPTVAATRRAYGRINSRAALRCLHRDVRRRVSKEAEGPAKPLSLVRVEAFGGGAGRAMRFTTTATSSYGLVQGYIDAVHLRAGRMLGALVIVSGLSILDEDVYEHAVSLFARRLRATSS